MAAEAGAAELPPEEVEAMAVGTTISVPSTKGQDGNALGTTPGGGAGGTGSTDNGQPGGATGGGGGGGGNNGTDGEGAGGGGGGIFGLMGDPTQMGSGSNGGNGGYGGGGGGGGGSPTNGALGGFGGGGGGGTAVSGALGGFGGGGGGGSSITPSFGGNGGFGGGGGGGTIKGLGGSGGGNGSVAGGGGGAGLGGAIFVNAAGGGQLTILDSFTVTNPAVQAGAGGNSSQNGAAAASGIFSNSSSTHPLTFTPSANATITIANNNIIGDDSTNTLPGGSYQPGTGPGAIVLMNGAGTLAISNANTYSGGTQLENGVLQVSNTGALGLSTSHLTFVGNGGTLQAGQTLAFPYPTVVNSGFVGSLDSNDFTLTMNNTISGTGGINKVGLGTVILATANSYSGGTTVSAGTLSVMTSTLPPADHTPLITILSPGTLVFTNTADDTYGGDIVIDGTLTNSSNPINLNLTGTLSGDGLIQMNSSGLTTLTVTSLFTGNMQINAGEIDLLENSAQTYSGTVSTQSTSTVLSKSGRGHSDHEGSHHRFRAARSRCRHTHSDQSQQFLY